MRCRSAHSALSPHASPAAPATSSPATSASTGTLPFRRDEPAPDAAAPAGARPAGSVYDRAAAQRAWAKRRSDLDQLGDVGDVLTDVDRQIAELQQRVNALLDSETT